MARPRLAIPRKIIVRLYVDERLSTREVARKLKVSRWIVVARLRELDVPLRERDDAADLARHLREVRADAEQASRCHWPNCPKGRSVGVGVCDDHLVAEAAGSGCAWPSCYQPHGWQHAFCLYHQKVSLGLIA